MTAIIEVLRERARGKDSEKNDIYYTPKQKRVLKTMAEHPHKRASEIADIAEVHPSYIPYIMDRVDKGVVENLHRLDEYLSERDGTEDADPQPEAEVTEGQREVMKTFGVTPFGPKEPQPTVEAEPGDGRDVVIDEDLSVEITVTFPKGSSVARVLESGGDIADMLGTEGPFEVATDDGVDSCQ